MFHALLIAAAVWLPTGAALAQHRPSEASPAPYAGLEARPIKALSGEQIADLKAGRGMGLALPAELNGYPGPLHVLELADALALTADQRARTQALYDKMKQDEGGDSPYRREDHHRGGDAGPAVLRCEHHAHRACLGNGSHRSRAR